MGKVKRLDKMMNGLALGVACCCVLSTVALPDIKMSSGEFEKQVNKKLFDTDVAREKSERALLDMEKKLQEQDVKEKAIDAKTKELEEKAKKMDEDIVKMEQRKDQAWNNVNKQQSDGDHAFSDSGRKIKDLRMDMEFMVTETKELEEKQTELNAKLEKTNKKIRDAQNGKTAGVAAALAVA